jgi:hypothetical protein
MSMSAGGGSKESSSSSPWAQQIPYILKGFSEADRLYGGGPATTGNSYPGSYGSGTAAGGGATGGGAPGGATGGGTPGGYSTYTGFMPDGSRITPDQTAGGGKYATTGNNGQMIRVMGPSGQPMWINAGGGSGGGGAGGGSWGGAGAGYGGIVGDYFPGDTVGQLSGATRSAGEFYRNNIGPSSNLRGAMGQTEATTGGAYLGANPGDPTFSGFSSGNNMYGDLTGRTASGNFLNANPTLDAMYDRSAKAVIDNYTNKVKPQVDSVFAKSGRGGANAARWQSEYEADAGLNEGLGNLATDIYYKNYADERQLMEQAQQRGGNFMLEGARGLSDSFQDERGNMMAAAGMAPELERALFTGADKAFEFGKYKDEYNQRQVDADKERWDYDQNKPYTALQRYMDLISGNYGGESTGKSSGGSRFGGSLKDVIGLAGLFA